MNRVVVLTGAAISAESGLQTFRGADGLLVVGTSLQVYPAAGKKQFNACCRPGSSR
jgi:NAD-dependent SIR2 family protein deacetylase